MQFKEPEHTEFMQRMRVSNLAEKLFCGFLTTTNPEGYPNGEVKESDFIPDPEGVYYKSPEGVIVTSSSSMVLKTIRERGSQMYRDDFEGDKRLIRECFHRAELFYSTIEKL